MAAPDSLQDTISAIRRRMPLAKIEVLTPDFQGLSQFYQDGSGCQA